MLTTNPGSTLVLGLDRPDIFAQAAATIDNFGLFRGFYGDGVELTAGGDRVRNGAIRDLPATVLAVGDGVYVAREPLRWSIPNYFLSLISKK